MTITVETIKAVVTRFYGVPDGRLTCHRRLASYAMPRHIAFYLCRELTDLSFPAIGDAFGGRHHSTVMHGFRAVKARMSAELRADIDALVRGCQDEAVICLGGMFRTRRNPPVFKSHRTQGEA